jgi:hypothetical protein
MACPSLEVSCVATLHVMRKFNWSFSLTCIFAVPCGALQNYGRFQSTVIWKRMCPFPPDSTPEHPLMYCPGPTLLYTFWGGTRFICKRRLVKLWSSGPSWKTLSSRPVWTGKREKIAATQHGYRSWEVRGCCVLISSFLSQPSNQMLGLYLGNTTHSSCAIWSQSCWGKSAVTFCILSFRIHLFIIVGLSLHFQYSGHIVKVVSYQYRSPSVSCARLKRFWSRRQFRQGFPCLPWMQPIFALDALVFISLLHDLFPRPYCSSRSIEMGPFLNFYKIVQPKLWCDKW